MNPPKEALLRSYFAKPRSRGDEPMDAFEIYQRYAKTPLTRG